eukprot:TRINITY_DN6574_c0_g1_i1.p2 TRINITY_DN6574_c0_g1~~TRINITY_DN6574_c0_g1_i1.p2  ORF type:complete len:101 (+),score=6.63 TRINITY_DN6574_c0_g1_i1:75-377(+)
MVPLRVAFYFGMVLGRCIGVHQRTEPHQHKEAPFLLLWLACIGCGRSESDSEASQARAYGDASTTTDDGVSDDSLGSLADMIVSDSESESEGSSPHPSSS